ncbi:hypothetical protein V8B97DRAFT_1920276 [Scleroderma yunnanense]
MSAQSCSSTIAPAPMIPIDWMKVTNLALKEHSSDDINTVVTNAKEKRRREEEKRVWKVAEEVLRKAEDKARREAEQAKQRRVKEKAKAIEETSHANEGAESNQIKPADAE